jgi:hypothetical protein
MIANEVVTVTTGVTLLVRGGGALNDARDIAVIPAVTNNCWVGGPGVTTVSGIPLSSTTVATSFKLGVNENLYAISTITNASVRVMASRSGSGTEVGN